MREFKRYAIYVTPEPGPLAEFGARWLGWDNAAGCARAHPDLPGWDVPNLTRTPRKYGFHGTIKPPFHLIEGTTQTQLQDAVEAFCAGTEPVSLEGLQLTCLGRFVALTPIGSTELLAVMAARAVQELDDFRAPPTESELARRRKSTLSPAQEAQLAQWGYPYVLSEFRYHMTLTGPMEETDAQRLVGDLHPHIAPTLPSPFTIRSLTLLGESLDNTFHEIQRVPLSG